MMITICINGSMCTDELPCDWLTPRGQQRIPGHYISAIRGEIKYEGRKMKCCSSLLHCTLYVYFGRYRNTLSIIILYNGIDSWDLN